MSYLLKEVIDNLDEAGFIMCDENLAFESLNDGLGLNVHHDIVITAHEVVLLKTALDELLRLTNYSELAKDAMSILEVK